MALPHGVCIGFARTDDIRFDPAGRRPFCTGRQTRHGSCPRERAYRGSDAANRSRRGQAGKGGFRIFGGFAFAGGIYFDLFKGGFAAPATKISCAGGLRRFSGRLSWFFARRNTNVPSKMQNATQTFWKLRPCSGIIKARGSHKTRGPERRRGAAVFAQAGQAERGLRPRNGAYRKSDKANRAAFGRPMAAGNRDAPDQEVEA